MPQAIPLIIGAIAGAAVYVQLAVLVFSMALSSYQKKKAKNKARAAFDSAQVDRLVNIETSVASHELVLGRVRKGGNIFFRTPVGSYKEMYVACIALAAHEIDGIERIYLNDQPVDIDGSGNVVTAPYARWVTQSFFPAITGAVTVLPHTPIEGSVSVTTGDGSQGSDNGGTGMGEVGFDVTGNTLTIPSFDPSRGYWVSYQATFLVSKARVRWHLGAPGQAADARLQALLPGVWAADHKATRTAYLIVEFDYDETAYPSGIPTATALLRGAKIYDPRSGLTQFSENPALMMRHVIMHPQFGKRTSMLAAEDARIVAAANACDPGISYTGSDWVSTYRAAVVIPFGQPARDALDDLSQAMGGQWAHASGEFFVRAGVYQAPVMALTEADLAVVQRTNDGSTSQNQISISTHRARNDKVNTILARIWDQAANYVQTPIQPFRADSLVAADGAELSQEITMPAVFYAGQAFHISGIILRDGRDPLTVTLPFKMKAYQLELFDTITLTLPRYGWTAKEFQILGRRRMPDGFIELTLKETSAAIYNYAYGFWPQGYASNSGLPRPWDIAPPTITGITSGEADLIVQSDGTIVNGVRVTWAPILDASITSGGYIEVQYMLVTDGVWRSNSVPGADTQTVLVGIADGVAIVIRARSKNAVAVSDWGLQVGHIVIGKTEPPPDIQNLSISGTILTWGLPRRIPDLAGFVFRFHYGVNVDWGSAAPLHDGIVTENPWEPKTRPGGVVTIMGKAIDTTGHVSNATANIVMNLGDPPVANIVEQWDFEAMGWPYAAGEQSGWTLVLGDPSADSLDSLYGTDDQSFYGADTDSFYDAGAYGQMVYVTTEVAVNSALSGSIMTLETQAQGDDLRIDYRLSGPSSLYETDNSSFYGPDADPFYGQPGGWQPWPGQLIAANDVYQFRVTIGASVERGILQAMVLTIDAPDIEESIADLPISSGGTAIPYTKPFTSIKTVQATLQANGSSAETVEINKTAPLAPVIRAFNSAHTAVSGATADIVIRGY